MQEPTYFRRIINLLETIDEGRKRFPISKGPVRSDVISHDPIPYSDRASKNDQEDWMRKAVGIDDDRSERVFLDPTNPKENRRIPMQVTYDPKEEVWIYIPDNGARTIGDVNATRIVNNLSKLGLKQNLDFKIDRFHGILKIKGKERKV